MTRRTLVASCTFLALSASPALAQGHGWGGRGGTGAAHFDPAALTTISGEVLAVHAIEGRRGRGIHLDVRSGSDVFDVHLGPSWFLEQQKTKVATGDQLEVTGARTMVTGKPVLVASRVKKGGEALALRDDDGIPVWAAHHRPSGAVTGKPAALDATDDSFMQEVWTMP